MGLSQYLFAQFPMLRWLELPALPLLWVDGVVPAGLGTPLIFMVIFWLVVRNRRVHYLIRFHVLQALVIDLALLLFSWILELLVAPLGFDFALRTLSNFVFLGALVLALFGIVQSLRGQEAEIPTLSEAVRMQL